MKIAYFTDTYLPRIDGVATTISDHSQILTSRGHEIIIYAPRYDDAKSDEIVNGVLVKRQPSVPLPAYKGTRIPFPKTLRIYRSIRKFNPDIIHIHTPGPIGLMGILLSKVLKKPLVGTYHTLFSETLAYLSPNDFFKLVGLSVPDKNLIEVLKIDRYLKRITWQTINKIYSSCQLVLAPSLPIKHLLKQQGYKESIQVLPTGINTEYFSENSGHDRKGHTILHVGRIGYEKNIDVVLKSFKKVLSSGIKAKLIIAGDGPALKDMKKLSSSLGISKSVKFTGFINRKELPKLYRTANIFVTASTMETLGLVVLEAMSCGLPVVAVNKYALPWVVKNNKNGFVVKPFSETEISTALVKILQDKDLALDFGKMSILIAKKFNILSMVTKLEKIYQELIEQKSRSKK